MGTSDELEHVMSPRGTTPRTSLVGQTRDVGFNVGARRSFALTTSQAWDWLTSSDGVKLWLGDVVGELPHEPKASYETRDGARGEIRVFEPGSHLRLTWQPKGWDRASLIQVRVRPAAIGATIAFHQEHLSGPRERAEMRKRWQAVLDQLASILG